eukprot:8716498-Pyramimonas_sp.AAC.1
MEGADEYAGDGDLDADLAEHPEEQELEPDGAEPKEKEPGDAGIEGEEPMAPAAPAPGTPISELPPEVRAEAARQLERLRDAEEKAR